MKTLMNRVRRFAGGSQLVTDQRGLSTVEYVIILVLIAVLAIGVWQSFGKTIRGKIDNSSNEIQKIDQPDTSDSKG